MIALGPSDNELEQPQRAPLGCTEVQQYIACIHYGIERGSEVPTPIFSRDICCGAVRIKGVCIPFSWSQGTITRPVLFIKRVRPFA